MSVGFTDKDEEQMLEQGYVFQQTELGKVYYPQEGILLEETIEVKYVEYPWITCFEVEGIRILNVFSEENGGMDYGMYI